MKAGARRASVLVLLVVASACVAVPSSHPRPRATTTTSTSTTSTIPASGPSSPVAPTLPSVRSLSAWNTPAARIATSARSADWAARYYANADTYDHEIGVEFGFDAPSNDYSVPVYSAADATTVARVFQRPVEAWNGRFDIEIGSTVPWNPAWLPSDGTDGFLVVVDPATGQEWNFWALSTPSFSAAYLRPTECSLRLESIALGYDPAADLCAASAMVVTTPDGKVADTRVYRGNYPPAGGGGIQNSAGLTTPAEVAAGVIPHAMKFAVSSQLSMTGPVCPDDVTSPDDPRVGTVCGVSVAPAGQFESSAIESDRTALSRMVPDGTRLVVDHTDAEIAAWLDSRGYTGRLRETARIFAVALRDYGLIQTDTTAGPAIVQVAGARNAATAQGWRDLGIVGGGSDLLAGLFTPDRLRVLEPATNQCLDRPSRLYCWATSTGY